jgi:hypothetical protein
LALSFHSLGVWSGDTGCIVVATHFYPGRLTLAVAGQVPSKPDSIESSLTFWPLLFHAELGDIGDKQQKSSKKAMKGAT